MVASEKSEKKKKRAEILKVPKEGKIDPKSVKDKENTH